MMASFRNASGSLKKLVKSNPKAAEALDGVSDVVDKGVAAAVKALPDNIEKQVAPAFKGVGDQVEKLVKAEAGVVSRSNLLQFFFSLCPSCSMSTYAG
jgi:hypothetical protein